MCEGGAHVASLGHLLELLALREGVVQRRPPALARRHVHHAHAQSLQLGHPGAQYLLRGSDHLSRA